MSTTAVINLSKGDVISLKKDEDFLSNIRVDMTWTNPKNEVIDADLSIVCAALENGKEVLYDADHFVFYRHTATANKSIIHSGDELVEGGESVCIDLEKIPSGVIAIRFFCTIHDAEKRRQHFGMVLGANVTIINTKNDTPVASYDIKSIGDHMTAVQVGAIYRKDDSWEFAAICDAMRGDLSNVLAQFGVKATYEE